MTPTTNTSRAYATRRALAPTETLLALTLAMITLLAAVWITDSFEDRLLENENERILTQLSTALRHYERETGTTPPGLIQQATAALLDHPDTRRHLDGLPLLLADNDQPILLDAYLNPLAYTETSQGSLPVGDFVSAGPDGRFGNAASDNPEDIDALIDDRYSSDFEALF
ncbi:hypothetical protein [Mucisphaera calidilacus]|uniref:Type II secretion system protein G n=1 Tax=Mucisphaera calidilacus TaxID=2527982 RepID=A0A518BXH1_9BACT|nr:hypothetical protein [Mucisphaera calidilacus]QDU71656.1 hypothetical protein Pan265_15080 [Mucisphaera calidilacus]